MRARIEDDKEVQKLLDKYEEEKYQKEREDRELADKAYEEYMHAVDAIWDYYVKEREAEIIAEAKANESAKVQIKADKATVDVVDEVDVCLQAYKMYKGFRLFDYDAVPAAVQQTDDHKVRQSCRR